MASGGIEFEDGVMAAPGLRIATIKQDMNERHTKYTYAKVIRYQDPKEQKE